MVVTQPSFRDLSADTDDERRLCSIVTSCQNPVAFLGNKRTVLTNDCGGPPLRSKGNQGSLAVVAAGCLCVALISTLSRVAALSVQAPDFLTSKDGGVLGTPFLPEFLVAAVVMIETSWLVVTASA